MLFSPSADGVTRDRAARDAVGVAPWLGIQVRHLAALESVAEEGSFNKAAKKLGYTQSAISQQVAALERIVGLRLIERPGGPRPISLTEAGEILLRHADAIQARLLAAKADMAALEAGDAGRLRELPRGPPARPSGGGRRSPLPRPPRRALQRPFERGRTRRPPSRSRS